MRPPPRHGFHLGWPPHGVPRTWDVRRDVRGTHATWGRFGITANFISTKRLKTRSRASYVIRDTCYVIRDTHHTLFRLFASRNARKSRYDLTASRSALASDCPVSHSPRPIPIRIGSRAERGRVSRRSTKPRTAPRIEEGNEISLVLAEFSLSPFPRRV